MTARAPSDPAAGLLVFLRAYTRRNGYAPSVREIVAAGHASSTSMAAFRLRQLEARGFIRRAPGIARGIAVVKEAQP